MASCDFVPTPSQPLPGPQLDPLCNLGTVVKGAVGDAAQNAQDAVTTWMGDALGSAMKAVTTSWIGIATPAVTNGDPSQFQSSDTVTFLHQSLLYVTAAIFVISAISGLAMMALAHKAEPGLAVVKMLIKFICLFTIGSGLAGLYILIMDGLASMVLDKATSGAGFGKSMGTMITDSGGLAFFLFVFLGALALLVLILQVVILLFRGGILPVLVGTWFVPAAFSNFEMGKTWLQKTTGWIVAWGMYKLVAACIYGAAFKLMTEGATTGADKTIEHISGIALLSLSIFALPATLRLVAPAVGAVANGKGFGAMAGAAVMTVASGAVAMGAMGGAAGAAGAAGGGSPGAPGAGGAGGTPPPAGGGPAGPSGSGGSTPPPPPAPTPSGSGARYFPRPAPATP